MAGQSDESIMALAIREAERAASEGEVPVGAVIVDAAGTVISVAHNLRESTSDATAHAEILAIRRACEVIGNWRLSGTSIYVTLEPCAMCMGAIVNARIDRVVFGAPDPKGGALVSNFGIGAGGELNHQVEFSGGVCGEQCAHILEVFFRVLRDS